MCLRDALRQGSGQAHGHERPASSPPIPPLPTAGEDGGEGDFPSNDTTMQGLASAFLRYSLTGLLVAGLDVSVYTLLSRGIGVWYLYAHTLSRAVGDATGFVLNRRRT